MDSLNGLVFPINALPSCQLVETGIDRISFDGEVKSEAVSRYYRRVDADLLLYFSDIVIQAEAMGAKIKFSPDAMPSVSETAPEIVLPNPSRVPRMEVNAQVLRRLVREFPNKLKSTLVYGPFTVAGQIAGEQNVLRGTIDAEEQIRQMDRLIAEQCSRMGLKTTRRYSPGYQDFPLEAQAVFVKIASGAMPELRLTSDFLLEPEKSITAIKGVLK